MIVNPEVETYCKTHTHDESALLQELREYTVANVSGAHMLSDILVGRTLQLLIRALQAKVVLDIGTFTGYSALSMAEALPTAGQVITCDKSLPHLAIARSFFAQSPFASNITIFEGLAADCIAGIQKPIDLAFIDADKMLIPEYIEALYPKLRQGGFLVIDNVLWDGEVVHPHNKKSQTLDKLNADIKKDRRFSNVLLPVRDGLNIMYKL